MLEPTYENLVACIPYIHVYIEKWTCVSGFPEKKEKSIESIRKETGTSYIIIGRTKIKEWVGKWWVLKNTVPFFWREKACHAAKIGIRALFQLATKGKNEKIQSLSVASSSLAVAYRIQSIDILGYQVQKERVGGKNIQERIYQYLPYIAARYKGETQKEPTRFFESVYIP